MAKKKLWTLAGAARAGREARIATVEYMRTAPMARMMELTRMKTEFDVKVAHLGGQQNEAGVLLFGGMGYRPPFPHDLREGADQVIADEARYLAGAELYVLSPQMCDVVVAAALSLTRQDLELLDEDDLPSLTGLVILPYPLVKRTVGGELTDLRAVMWQTPSQMFAPTSSGLMRLDQLPYRPAVRISSYDDAHGPIQPESFVQLAALARRQGTPFPPLMLNGIRCTPFRFTPTVEQERSLQDYQATAREQTARKASQFAALGWDEEAEGDYTPGQEIDDVDDTFINRFLYAFWRLCEQRIAAVDPGPVNHSAQMLAERAGVPAEVRVVQLRRTHHSDAPQEPSGKDWQHQWVVRMHKVRQWYPTEQRHKVIYRGPYLKGPADKPLLGGETVRGLYR